MLAIEDHWMRSELERNHTLRRDEKSQGELAHSLDPTDNQGGFSSGGNIHTEREPLVSKGPLSDMTGNIGVMVNNI